MHWNCYIYNTLEMFSMLDTVFTFNEQENVSQNKQPMW